MRNPFSVADVPDPTGPDVEGFASDIAPTDLENDENAMAWVAISTRADGLEGAWSSRWRIGDGPWHQGVATIHLDIDSTYVSRVLGASWLQCDAK